MSDIGTLLIIFLITVGFAWFVQRKAKKGGGFGRWLWMAVFGAISAFFVFIIFTTIVHIENIILKQLTMFLVLAIVTPTAGILGGMLYDKRN